MHAVLATDHEVHVHSHRPGLPKHFTPFDPSLVYDLALINHGACLVDLRRARIDTRIFTSHIPWQSTIIRNHRHAAIRRPRTRPRRRPTGGVPLQPAGHVRPSKRLAAWRVWN